MKRALILLAILCIVTVTSFAQDINRRSEMKFGTGIQFFGPTNFVSIEVDYFITHNWNVEVGAGLFGVYGAGKYYFGSADVEKKWAPFIGASYRLPKVITGGQIRALYFPIGMQYMSKNGFTFATDLGYINAEDHIGIAGGLRFGWHF